MSGSTYDDSASTVRSVAGGGLRSGGLASVANVRAARRAAP